MHPKMVMMHTKHIYQTIHLHGKKLHQQKEDVVRVLIFVSIITKKGKHELNMLMYFGE